MIINRKKEVFKTSLISIITNILLSSLKAAIGFMSNSIAIITDAVNNLSDALSSIITIIGTKLASKAPDKKHPYGYGRIEYMTSLIVSAIVLYAGNTSLVESLKKIFNPSETTYTNITLIILIIGILVKLLLGIYVKDKGKKVNSDALVASGTDSFTDAVLSISVLFSIIIKMLFNINIESYIGLLLSVCIIKTALELIKDSVDNMIGVRVDSILAKKIKNEVIKEKDVKGAFDLILTNYGPDTYLGSIHIEVDDTLTVYEIDKISRRITKNILDKFGVTLHTIGVYSINTKDKKIVEIRKKIHDIVFSHNEVLQMHGFYVDEIEKTISFDIIINFEAPNRVNIYKQIYDEIVKNYSEYKVNIALDVDISD